MAQNDQERTTQENRGVAGLLFDKNCPFEYKCLAMDRLECVEIYAAMEGENNGGK